MTTTEERAADAARARRVRARQRRDRLVAEVAVLDAVAANTPRPRTSTAVAQFYGVGETVIGHLLRRHHDEFTQDGWQEVHPRLRNRDLWTDRAVVRAGLLIDGSQVAATVRHLLGIEPVPVMFSTDGGNVNRCAALYSKAVDIVENVRDTCPAEVWRDLLKRDRCELMALVVTLAALVPDDTPGTGMWLRELASADGQRGSIGRGLAMLVPVRSQLYDDPGTDAERGSRRDAWAQEA